MVPMNWPFLGGNMNELLKASKEALIVMVSFFENFPMEMTDRDKNALIALENAISNAEDRDELRDLH